jgi:hypothetical protein
MLNTEPVFGLAVMRAAGWAKNLICSFEGVNGKPVGQVPDRVDVDLVACSCPVASEHRERSRVDEERARRTRLITVWLKHRTAPAAKCSI